MVKIENDKCIGCGLCVSDCVAGYLTLNAGKVTVKSSGCISCGHCYAVCPQNAISIEGMECENDEPADLAQFDSQTLLQAMKSRRSIRSFKSQSVEQEKVQKILEAGRYCPTGSNAQDVAYTILGSRQEEIEKICVDLFRKGQGAAGLVSETAKSMQIDDRFFFKGAPLVIVVSGKSTVNAALASSYMELMAESLGLGVLYSGFFVACTHLSAKLRGILDLPQGHKAITCMVIGYSAVKYQRIPARKKSVVKIL